jgi:hypothetical protein
VEGTVVVVLTKEYIESTEMLVMKELWKVLWWMY